MQESCNKQMTGTLDKMDGGRDDWDIECIVTAEKGARPCIHGKLLEVQRVCKDDVEA